MLTICRSKGKKRHIPLRNVAFRGIFYLKAKKQLRYGIN